MNDYPHDNVVIRLKQKLRHARGMGFNVRMEMLDGEQATWCEIAGVPTLFVDISQTAAEQLQQVDETLRAYLQWRGCSAPQRDRVRPGANDRVRPGANDRVRPGANDRVRPGANDRAASRAA